MVWLGRAWRRIPSVRGTQENGQAIILSVCWNIWNQSFFVSNNLNFTWHVANIYHHSIDLQNPNHRIIVYTAGQAPIGVKLKHIQCITNKFCFVCTTALTNAKYVAQFICSHVRSLRSIKQKVYCANGVNNCTIPNFWFSPQDWGGTFACEGCR